MISTSELSDRAARYKGTLSKSEIEGLIEHLKACPPNRRQAAFDTIVKNGGPKADFLSGIDAKPKAGVRDVKDNKTSASVDTK